MRLSERETIASELERGIPLTEEPFAEIAGRLSLTEPDVLNAAGEMLESGLMRRFGAFFDYHRLGYTGYLFGMETAGTDEQSMMARICEIPSVTHAYGRRHKLNFWFTALSRGDIEARHICSVIRDSGCVYVTLETEHVIKLRPSFSRLNAEEENRVFRQGLPGDTAACNSSIINTVLALQDGISLSSRPFDAPAEMSGMKPGEFLRETRQLSELGILRRIGASFDHRRAGWTSNSLCAAEISCGISGFSASAAEMASRRPWVSHCYLRRLYDCSIRAVWPYNLYMMIHASSDSKLTQRENILRLELGEPGFIPMRTAEEYKKTSFRIERGIYTC